MIVAANELYDFIFLCTDRWMSELRSDSSSGENRVSIPRLVYANRVLSMLKVNAGSAM